MLLCLVKGRATVEVGLSGVGKTALVRACAQALDRHPLCRTHVVWVNCRDVETETLAKAKSCLLPLVRPLIEHALLLKACVRSPTTNADEDVPVRQGCSVVGILGSS